jgi:hypothetical protein
MFADRTAAARLGTAGQRLATKMFSVREAGGCIRREIDRIWAGGGKP